MSMGCKRKIDDNDNEIINCEVLRFVKFSINYCLNGLHRNIDGWISV